jgi:hypothetical protein
VQLLNSIKPKPLEISIKKMQIKYAPWFAEHELNALHAQQLLGFIMTITCMASWLNSLTSLSTAILAGPADSF